MATAPLLVKVLSLRLSTRRLGLCCTAVAKAVMPGWLIPFCGMWISSRLPINWTREKVPIKALTWLTDQCQSRNIQLNSVSLPERLGKVQWHHHSQVDYVLLQRLLALEASRQHLIACSIQLVQRPGSRISRYCFEYCWTAIIKLLAVLLTTTAYCASSNTHATIIQPEFLKCVTRSALQKGLNALDAIRSKCVVTQVQFSKLGPWHHQGTAQGFLQGSGYEIRAVNTYWI